jgi:hypothetical protein
MGMGMSTHHAMPAGCDVGGCGVAGIGRCSICGRVCCESLRLGGVCVVCGRGERASDEELRLRSAQLDRAGEVVEGRLRDVLNALDAAGQPGAEPLLGWKRRKVAFVSMWTQPPTGKYGWSVGPQRWGTKAREEELAPDVEAETFVTPRVSC